jgi:hypothetical protein
MIQLFDFIYLTLFDFIYLTHLAHLVLCCFQVCISLLTRAVSLLSSVLTTLVGNPKDLCSLDRVTEIRQKKNLLARDRYNKIEADMKAFKSIQSLRVIQGIPVAHTS